MGLRKEGICMSIILLISILGITSVNALNTPEWHTADKISIIKQDCPSGTCLWSSQWTNTLVNLEEITPLKTAISYTFNYLDYIDATPIIGGHNASEIWVKVRPSLYNMYTEEMTLLQALKTAWGLCPAYDITNTTYSGPTNRTTAFHYATEIEVTIDGVTTTLQDAINGGTFCWNYYWATGEWTGGAGCGTITQTRTVNCIQSDTGAIVDDSKCTEIKPATSQSYYHQCYWTYVGSTDVCCWGCSCPSWETDVSYFDVPRTCSDYGTDDYGYSSYFSFCAFIPGINGCITEHYKCY